MNKTDGRRGQGREKGRGRERGGKRGSDEGGLCLVGGGGGNESVCMELS